MSTGLHYKNLRASLGAVDYEKGHSWKLMADARYVHRTYYPHVVAAADYGLPLPIHHSSLWLRTAAGYGWGERDEPFTNFYFGGFGNNWVDHLPEKRYREYYSFPGLELNEIGGISFGKAIFEWSLPSLSFRRFGFPALYCSWVQTAVFAGGIVTNADNRSYRRKIWNVGSQMDLRMQLLSHLKLTLSFGYARALQKRQQYSEEFMLSLKVL